MWTGQVGRRAVAQTFDVSVGHVTQDFRRYREMAPSNLSYDVKEKCFRPTDSFHPVFDVDGPSDVLRTIAATASLPSQDRSRLLGFALPADTVHPLPTAIEQGILSTICRAITTGTGVAVNYQSMNTPEPVTREFAPRALIFSGQRWLVRGWDGLHASFRDLALGRLLCVTSIPEFAQHKRDDQWHDSVTLHLSLIEGLSASQAQVTAREFGMVLKGETFLVPIEARQAMVPYILDHLRLRPSDSQGAVLPIQLINYNAIKAFDRINLQ